MISIGINHFVRKRLLHAYKSQLAPAVLAFVGIFWMTISLNSLKSSDYYLLFIVITALFLFRVLATLFFLRFNSRWSDQTLYYYEYFTAFYMSFLGISYSLFTISMERLFPEHVASLYIIFFILVLGALRTYTSSFLTSITVTIASFGTLFIRWSLIEQRGTYINVFTYLFVPLYVIYLIKSQFDSAKDFVLKTHLLENQKENIDQLQQKIALEEELKKQKEANIHSSRLTSLGEMASGISHEINNPLAIISMNIKTLEIQENKGVMTTEKWLSGFNNIKVAVERATKIINSLRIFARDDRLSDIGVITVDQVIALVKNLVERRFEVNNISLDFEFECDPNREIKVNEVALSQVLVNLLNNSFYILDKDEKSNHWCKVKVTEAEKYIIFKVIDSGDQIPEEVVSKLFVPFYTTKPPGEGTGVGLSISKSMMQNMGGDLIYDSSADHTTFIISTLKNE